ncbi:SCO1/SenC family protein [Stigmatella aurantiaca DW4/3-1]|uniref:SCO1/SenC family protein n=2 Tax=Stigmatella aurantiaca (strain DW4/3-1) TaxID=378806 RepID=Q08PD6_STIAD|nr:SCO1/SenC family protein [Stigmatella aurantiaca DW4/3-1]
MGAARLLPLMLAVLLTGCWRDKDFAVEPAQEAPALEATRSSGTTFRLSALRGKVVILSFGYTACPDVCPTTLSRLNNLQRRLGMLSQDLEVVFITVDPERDTERRLNDYVNVFNRRFTALRLEDEALTKLLTAYRVTATRRYPDSERYSNHAFTGEMPYTVDHTGGYFVIDRGGTLRLRIPYDTPLERLQESVEGLLQEEL